VGLAFAGESEVVWMDMLESGKVAFQTSSSAALAMRFGAGAVDGKIQAHVISVRA